MNINYKITEYFETNKLFDSDETNGLSIKNENNILLIKGNSRDLVELADLLINVALSKEKSEHIHIDDFTILNSDTDFFEIIIEKNNK